MITQDTETHEVVTPGDLKPLATANGPCLTAVVPLPGPLMEPHIKNAIRGLQQKLAERATEKETISSLLAPIHDLATSVKAAGVWAHALIVFRSPDLFRYYLLHGQFAEMQTVNGRFQVRPLLRMLAHETRFHLLCLSQHEVRLLHCTQHGIEPVATRLPQSLEAWLNNRQPDHLMASRSNAGRSVGGMKGVVSGTNTDRERQDEYLHHFFKEVDKDVIGHLRSENTPLVLAGVENDIAIYRRVNSYKPTLEKAVKGSPDGMPDRTLHSRAMEVVTGTFTEPLQRVMAEVRERAGTARCSTDPRTIVRAAFQGRVLDLIIAADAEYWGTWNEETQDVADGRHEELLNAAALETIRNGGRAYVLDEPDMPVKTGAAAVFRF